MRIKEIDWIHNDLDRLEGVAYAMDVAPDFTARQRMMVGYVQNVRRLLKVLLPRDLNEAPTKDEQ